MPNACEQLNPGKINFIIYRGSKRYELYLATILRNQQIWLISSTPESRWGGLVFESA